MSENLERPLDYEEMARVVHLYLEQFCDGNLPYPDMCADAVRKAKSALEAANQKIEAQAAEILKLEKMLQANEGRVKNIVDEVLVAERDDQAAEIEKLKEELERERLRLACCGVAALGYFDGCAEEYKSASLDDVLRLHAERDRLKATFEESDKKCRELQSKCEIYEAALKFYADTFLGNTWVFRKKFMFDIIGIEDLEELPEPVGEKGQKYVIGGRVARQAILDASKIGEAK